MFPDCFSMSIQIKLKVMLSLCIWTTLRICVGGNPWTHAFLSSSSAEEIPVKVSHTTLKRQLEAIESRTVHLPQWRRAKRMVLQTMASQFSHLVDSPHCPKLAMTYFQVRVLNISYSERRFLHNTKFLLS